jgi:alkanesulfonate monooxygenase SsuD/methylene tetrahydromethanopterin reductase-like flavin-dependent oxidoreductase (luciferase family)
MKNEIKFGVRISRALATRDTSGFVKGIGVNRKPFDREIVIYPYEHVSWNAIKETVLEAECLGYDLINISDHLMLGKERFEAWTLQSAIGAITKKIRLGQTVLCYAYRGLPSIFAKQVATLDNITGGRLDIGMGCGYEKNEFEAYGLVFPATKIRIAQLNEYLDILKLMWTESIINYQGKYYNIKNARSEPKPIQKPYPPIMIGANRKLMLRLAAKHANIVNFEKETADTIDVIKKRIRILEEACDSIGRDPSEIIKSWGEWVVLFEDENEVKKMDSFIKMSPRTWCGLPEEYIERIKEYIEIGISYITPRFMDLPNKNSLKLFAEIVIPHFR